LSEYAFDERHVSPYSADDSDDRNEQNNYWQNWERAERMASATFCDYQSSCWNCIDSLECSDIEDVEVLYAFTMVMNPNVPFDLFKTVFVVRNKELEWWYEKRW